jgi:hypothetical protein
MANAIMEGQLRTAIDTDSELANRGCGTRLLQPSGLSVHFGAMEVGVWYWRNGRFELFVDGKGPVVALGTVAEALRYTRERLSR